MNDDEFSKRLEEIKERLDVILLAIVQKDKPGVMFTLTGSSECNCHKHVSGRSTGGWFCPVHGQMF